MVSSLDTTLSKRSTLSNGVVMMVVANAMITSIVKKVGEKAPTSYAIFRTTISTRPRVFNRTPSAKANVHD